MTERQVRKIMKRDRRRRRAQGLGAATGILLTAFGVGLLYGDRILKKVDEVSEQFGDAAGYVHELVEELGDALGYTDEE